MSTHPELIRNGVLTVNGARVPVLSGEIHFFRMSPETWDTALANLKAIGLPMVSTYLSWRRFSLGPDRYDLEGRTDPRLNVKGFLELCRKHGLWVTMKPGPWICAEEANGGYPDWLVEREELQVLNAAGEPVQGYTPAFRSPIPSYLHPAYLEAVRVWLREVDAVIADYVHPRGPIILVQLDNEPSMTFHDRLLESDYNRVNVGKDGLYSQWLEGKYGTISKLNRTYRSSWPSFSCVEAPRSIGPEILETSAPWADWVEFKELMMVRHVAKLAELHRENGLAQVVFTINYNEHPQLGVPNDWRSLELASGMGGFDFYPRMPLGASGLADVALFVGYSRACNVIPWSPEIMSGKWSFEGQEHEPGELRSADFELLYLSCIAFGLKGMNFYMFADRDNWIDSPLDAAGCPRPNLEAVRNVVRLVSEEPELESFDRNQPVAVLYYRPHAREAFIADASPAPLTIGGFCLGSSYSCFKSIFSELHRLNLDPAVVDPWVGLGTLTATRPEMLPAHRLLFVPGGSSMDEATLRLLDDFVAGGGSVVWVGRRPERDLGGGHFTGSHCCLTEERTRGVLASPTGEPDSKTLLRILDEERIGPEVPASVPGILTTLHRSRSREWLFVVNIGETRQNVELRFPDPHLKGMISLPGGNLRVRVKNSSARLTCEPQSVQVWRLDP